ncbi:Crp/Fnr family transcriptional regulator [Anaerosporobacter faecicola]|uniref:Crp/Fnr family transcriptional regulator n=1 Tax=Anaerosporobacter faecicola TaxID=2718714 RepID=UPI001439F9EA|nr:Crp/Fnr family transcriptional regulator [Anaerosporobacter faecicola]
MIELADVSFLESAFSIVFSKEEQELLLQKANRVTYKKGEIPIMMGDELEAVSVIQKGVVRGFYIEASGKEVTKCFSCENGLFGCEGMFHSNRATFMVECLEEIQCIRVPYHTIRQLEKIGVDIKDRIQQILLQEFAKLENRSKVLLLCDAPTRYQMFCKEYEPLLGRIKQKYIASYLGINPVSLSRLKKYKYYE